MEDRSFNLFIKQLQLLNQHLAKSKLSLEQLLKDEKPRIELRDESSHVFKKDELEKLSRILPQDMHAQLMLPIYIELGSERYGSGTARVSGKPDCIVVSKILNRRCDGDETFIYRPEIKKLRKELPTTTQYIFTMAIEQA